MSDDEQLDQEARALYEARYGEENASHWDDFSGITHRNWRAVAERARQLYASPTVVEPTYELRASPSMTTVGSVRTGDTLIIGSAGRMTDQELGQFAEQWRASIGDHIRVVVISDCVGMVTAVSPEVVEQGA
ncbi:MAG TPA: hypothetical protein VIV58_26165 [Kofleriaceae bacterium]